MKPKAPPFSGSYFSYAMLFFFFYFSMASFSSVLSVYLTGIGKPATEMSFIVSAADMFSFVMMPLVGFLCDRLHNPRLICCTLLLLMSVTAMLFSQCRQVWALFLLDGITLSMLNSVTPVTERLAAACRYRYGTLRVWGTMGYAAGAQVAGLFIEHFPAIVLFLTFSASALLAVVGFLGTGRSSASTAKKAEKEPVRLTSLLHSPHFLLYLAITFVVMGCSGANMTYAPMLLNEMGLSTTGIGTVLSVGTLVEIPILLFSHKFMDRFSGKFLLRATLAVFIAQYLCYTLARSAWLAVAAMLLLKAIASTMMVMIALKMVRNLIPAELTTTGLSVVNSLNNLGTIAMQNIGGTIVDHSTVQMFYLVMSGLALLALVLTAFLKVGNNQKVFS